MIRASLGILNVFPEHPRDATWPWCVELHGDVRKSEEDRRQEILYLARSFRNIIGTFITEDTPIDEFEEWLRSASDFLRNETDLRKLSNED